MAHPQQKQYCVNIKSKLNGYFKNGLVLDIGSLDINGNNQYLFENCGYLGVDIRAGRNVDIVSKGHELKFPDETFDVIISTECFEHDRYYAETILNCYRMLKKGGLLLFTCATTGRPEHGTRRTTPEDAPFLQDINEWADYYKNLEEQDIRDVLDIESSFSMYEFGINSTSFDLYFYGIKQGQRDIRSNYSFLVKDKPLPVYGQLFFKSDDVDFCEEESKIIEIEYGKGVRIFRFEIGEEVKDLRFDPMNAPCIVKDIHFFVETDSKTIELDHSYSNSTSFDSGVYYFEVDDPQIYAKLRESTYVKSVEISIDYVEFGHEALTHSILKRRNDDTEIIKELRNECENLKKYLTSSIVGKFLLASENVAKVIKRTK